MSMAYQPGLYLTASSPCTQGNVCIRNQQPLRHKADIYSSLRKGERGCQKSWNKLQTPLSELQLNTFNFLFFLSFQNTYRMTKVGASKLWPTHQSQLHGPSPKTCLSIFKWLKKKIETIIFHHMWQSFEIQILVSMNRAFPPSHAQFP